VDVTLPTEQAPLSQSAQISVHSGKKYREKVAKFTDNLRIAVHRNGGVSSFALVTVLSG